MEKILLFVTVCLMLNSCTKSNEAAHTTALEMKDIATAAPRSVLDTISDKEFIKNDTSVSSAIPKTSQLPFGPSEKSSAFYSDLIGKGAIGDYPVYTTTYRLPLITKVRYIVIDSAEEEYICREDIPIDSLFRINKYRYRLPDLGEYEIYYMCDDATKFHDFTGAFERYCGFKYQFYGYLIMVQKKSGEAKVLLIYYTYYSDAYKEREFYVDKDYKITLIERMVSEGEDGADDPVIVGRYEVNLKPDGSVKMKNLLSPGK